VAHATTTDTEHHGPAGVPTAVAVMAKSGAENFPVASRLLPRAQRQHLLAIYGFARLADDIGDEATGDRLALLDWLDGELTAAALGHAHHPVLVRLGPTIETCHLPLDPFRRLIEANRRDQVVTTYETLDELFGYCELSANPVGELVLRVFGAHAPERRAWSDHICTGLQIVEHLQDVGEDAAAGRIYVPAEILRHHGTRDGDLGATTASPALRAAVLDLVTRTRPLLDDGVPLAASLRGRVRVAVAAFAAGGQASLDAIAAAGGDVLAHRCSPRPRRALARLVQVLATGRWEHRR
jgi:squalene synthase HpnC